MVSDTSPRGTKVTCTDLYTGESDSKVIENDYVVVCDGNRYVYHIDAHASGTHVITIRKRDRP